MEGVSCPLPATDTCPTPARARHVHNRHIPSPRSLLPSSGVEQVGNKKENAIIINYRETVTVVRLLQRAAREGQLL